MINYFSILCNFILISLILLRILTPFFNFFLFRMISVEKSYANFFFHCVHNILFFFFTLDHETTYHINRTVRRWRWPCAWETISFYFSFLFLFISYRNLKLLRLLFFFFSFILILEFFSYIYINRYIFLHCIKFASD